jgi:pyrimidine operon attenuation protein/uracil phosphoribosyltransferase
MKILTTSLQFLKTRIVYSQQASALGRWTRETCDIKTYRRVDLTNEDHCGVCNQPETVPENNKDNYIILNDDIVYLY